MADKPPTPVKPQSGARALVRIPPPVDNRVREIRLLMERGEWLPRSAGELADRWGLSVDRVQAHSAEASRQLRSLDREPAVARVEALLRDAQAAAAYSKTRSGDLTRVALALMKLYGLDHPTGARGASGSDKPAPAEGPPAGWTNEGEG
jgi:hypothetical protein